MWYLTVEDFLALLEPRGAWAGVATDHTLQGHHGAVLTELVPQWLLKSRLFVHTVNNKIISVYNSKDHIYNIFVKL